MKEKKAIKMIKNHHITIFLEHMLQNIAEFICKFFFFDFSSTRKSMKYETFPSFNLSVFINKASFIFCFMERKPTLKHNLPCTFIHMEKFMI